MQIITLTVDELIELENMAKVSSKKGAFVGVNFRTIGGVLRMTSTSNAGYMVRTMVLSNFSNIEANRGFTIDCNNHLTVALKMLIGSLKKFPDQKITLTVSDSPTIGYDDFNYNLTKIDNEYVEFSHILDSINSRPTAYLEVNRKQLKLAIDLMQDDTVYVCFSQDKGSAIVRGASGIVTTIGIQGK